jgi:hypothetical protein
LAYVNKSAIKTDSYTNAQKEDAKITYIASSYQGYPVIALNANCF